MKANINDLQTVFSELPSRYIYENTTYDNYQLLTELHFQQGWRNVELPIITEVQKLSDNYILVGDIITKEVIDLTAEEIAEKNKILVPQIISRRQFKIALAVLGYNESKILTGVDTLPEPNRTIARISYTECGTFERYSQDLIFVGKTFLQLTDEQIDEVFITGNNY